jgi:predicted GNAT family N-acyltransferase
MTENGASIFRVVRDRDDLLRVFCIRSIVFVGEQSCPFREEFDGYDDAALHVLGELQGEPFAAGRLRVVDEYVKLERIAVLQRARHLGLGHRLVDFMIVTAREQGFHKYKMHAQAHLEPFYAQHGFERRGELFVEAGIDHYLMVREDLPEAEA